MIIRRLTLFLLVSFSITPNLFAQEISKINNLEYAPSYTTTKLGELHIYKTGNGKQPVILIADAGFDKSFFDQLADTYQDKFQFYIVSLPGSKEVAGYPLPSESYSEKIWLNSIDTSLVNLIKKENLSDVIIGGHLTISTYIVLRFIIDHPNLVSKAFILAGQPYASWPSQKDPSGQTPVSFEERKGSIDYYMAPIFYKTLPRSSWQKGLYQPDHYSLNDKIGKKLYKLTSSAPIPVMIQLLCEYFTTDISLEFSNVRTPTLILQPSFDRKYLSEYSSHKSIFWDSWEKAKKYPTYFNIKKIQGTRLSLGYEHVNIIKSDLNEFLLN